MQLIQLLDREGLRWAARAVLFSAYFVKGEKIKSVNFNSSTRLWEYKIGNSFFVTKNASWFSSDEYYLQTLKKYAGYFFLPQPGNIVMDIGAGVGEELLPFAKGVGDQGKVFALEANPKTFSILEAVSSANQLTNVSLFNLAISDKAGSVLIEDDVDYGVANSLTTSGKSFSVSALSLDEFVRQHRIEKIDLLKANIEGAERFLVKGMKNSIPRIRHIAISCHDFRFLAGESDFFKTRDEVVSFLSPYFTLKFQNSGDPVRDNYVYGVNKNSSVTL